MPEQATENSFDDYLTPSCSHNEPCTSSNGQDNPKHIPVEAKENSNDGCPIQTGQIQNEPAEEITEL